MSQDRQLKDSTLWDRISRATDAVRTLPDWNFGSDKNERKDETKPENPRAQALETLRHCE